MSVSSNFTSGLQLNAKTANALDSFARRRRRLLVLRGIAAGLVVYVMTMLMVAICDYLWLLSDGMRWTLSLVGYCTTMIAVWHFGIREIGKPDPKLVARQLETADPRLREDLLSAVELADPNEANGSRSFRQQLQTNVAKHTAILEINRLLPVGLIQRWLLACMLIFGCCLLLTLIPKMQFGRRIARAMLPLMSIERASLTQLTILKPSPASGFVAEGDAVGVTVQVDGKMVRDVWMQYRTEDGIDGETPMTARVLSEGESRNGTLEHQNTYAANLSVGTTPVEYRIIAGDAITLWHELTPLPRPRVASFKKRYEFPDYSKLPDRIEEAEHGDLKALVGTKAELIVEFDEPVDDATLSFGNRGVAFKLDPVEGTDRAYVTTIPIRTPANYQVDAISRRSGLNNPFSPQYSVTPIIDSPPTVKWASDYERKMIVSPLDSVPLHAIVLDDIPLEKIIQEFSINGQPLVRRTLPCDQPAREIDLRSEWDLLHRVKNDESSIQLKGGDIIQTRIVAIDRKNQRGESVPIEIYIADEGFDSARHDHLNDIRLLTDGIADWSEKVQTLMERMREASEKRQLEPFASGEETAMELRNECEQLSQLIHQTIRNSIHHVESSELELLGRATLDIDRKITAWFSESRWALDQDAEDWRPSQEKILREMGSRAGRLMQDASRVEQYSRGILGEALTIGIVNDAMALQTSLQTLLDKDPVPEDRLTRHVAVALGRLEAIEQLIDRHDDALPDSTLRHLENWSRWVDLWVTRLSAAIKEPPKEDAFRALIKQFASDLRNQHRSGMYDSRLSATLSNMLREIRIQIGSSGDGVRKMLTHGTEADKTRKQIDGSGDSKQIAVLNRTLELHERRFEQGRKQLLNRLTEEEKLHRERQNVDLQYAADLNLMQRAIENVTENGFQPYREETAAAVYQKLGHAFQTLEANHELAIWLSEIQILMMAERKIEPNADAKFEHSTQIERIGVGMEWPVRAMQNAGLDWNQLLARIDRVRYDTNFTQARNLITSRRWSDDQMISADGPLRAMERELKTGMADLIPSVKEAREIIRQYVLTLPEQAREAAEKVKEAEQRTETRPNSNQETTEQLAEQQREAEEATQETLEALVDLANTSKIIDENQRELARDADSATAQIQDAAKRAEDAMDQAERATNDEARSEALDKTEQALEDLGQVLEQTAEHFQRAEDGKDLSETREQLRQAEAALQMQEELDQRYNEASEMAEAAQGTPQELLEQLEQELQQSPPMQEELSEIAERAAEAAQQQLEQAADNERQLNRDVESSDPNVLEQKRRTAKEITNLAQRTTSLDQSLLEKAERSVGWANVTETRPKLEEARQQLRQAVQQADALAGEKALLSEMQETANAMSEAIEKANKALEQVKQESDAVVEENIHKDDASRNRAKSQLEGFAREARSQQLRSASTEKQQWAAAEREADRRAAQAKSQKRTAENRQRPLENRLQREEKNTESLKQQIADLQQQIETADAVEQAAKETKEFADQREKVAQEREQAMKNQKLPGLEKPNPAAELASRMTDQAQQELQQIQNSLREISERVDIEDQLRAPESQTRALADRQERIESQLDNATEQLRRAARHEERLGQDQLAQQLDQTADAIEQSASQAAAKASDALQQASEKPETTPEANRSVAQAAETIDQVAQQLAQLLEASASDDKAEAMASQQNEGTPNQQQAEQKAQTLDELDRAIAEAQQNAQLGDASQAEQSQQASQQPAEQNGQQPGEPQNAADASPTLADAMESQAQQAARQRQEQMNPSQPPSSSNPASEPGNGQAMPDGGRLDIGKVDRIGNDWGQLRERRTDDASESRTATVAPQYRREIEAYFRAIAKQAAEKSQ